jgi:hypothetical protein
MVVVVREAASPIRRWLMETSSSRVDARSLGQLILDAKQAVDAAEWMEEALIDISAILMLPADAETKLERIRQRVAKGSNRG